MKKLRMDLDALSVQSFATASVSPVLRGTVNGRVMARTGSDCYRITQDAACGPYTTQTQGPQPSEGGTCELSVCIPLTAPAGY